VHYERAASSIAAATLDTFDAERLRAEPVEFAVILFRNLLLWSTTDDGRSQQARIRTRAEEYLRLIWPRFVRPSTDGSDRRERLIEHAAIVEMIAMLCWPPDRYDGLV
jgi:hypothetical protein